MTKSAKSITLAENAKRKIVPHQKRAESLIALITRRKARIAEDFYEIGEALRELSKPELYGALGYATFVELLENTRILSSGQAHKLMGIVKAYPREMALSLGSEKAYEIVRYAAATPAMDMPRAIVESGKLAGKSLEKLSSRDIAEARKKVRAKNPKATRPKTPREELASRTASAWQAALRKKGARGAKVSVRAIEGRLWVEALVPLAQVERASEP